MKQEEEEETQLEEIHEESENERNKRRIKELTIPQSPNKEKEISNEPKEINIKEEVHSDDLDDHHATD